uniref:Uncharacterized protein n=1 Tax=Anguilla anguilla TaxID=7936 RepID=A0A0E9R7X1_ANGAN
MVYGNLNVRHCLFFVQRPSLNQLPLFLLVFSAFSFLSINCSSFSCTISLFCFSSASLVAIASNSLVNIKCKRANMEAGNKATGIQCVCSI